MSIVTLGLKSSSKQSLIAEVNFYHFGVRKVYFTANAIGVSLPNFTATWRQDNMLPTSEGYGVFSGNSHFMGQEDKFKQNETSFRANKACLIESEAQEFTWQFRH